MSQQWQKVRPRVRIPYCDVYVRGRLQVIVGREPQGPNGEKRWHLSISHPWRYPTWEEIKLARYQLVPDEVEMAMYLPSQSEYVNLHENCFHLHECCCYLSPAVVALEREP